ncbi:MAG: glycosyltransferase family 9 protein [Candidatus Binataceae bacterium]
MSAGFDAAIDSSLQARPREAAPGFRRTFVRPQVRLALALKAIANLMIVLLRRCLWRSLRPSAPGRVCIYRIGNLGDTACAIPAMRAIRLAFPRAHLTLVTSPGRTGMPGASELLRGVSWLDEIVVYHSKDVAGPRAQLRWISAMRARNFDAWIELPPVDAPLRMLVRNMFAAWMSGAGWGFGWRYDRMRLFARAQSELGEFPNETARLAGLLATGGFAAPAAQNPSENSSLETSDAERAAVDQILAGMRLADASFVALAPGAKAPANRWPAERFIEVGRELAARGIRVVVLGGAGEAGLCETIVTAIGTDARSVAGRTTVRESCELLRRCALLVCNDSGVQHLASLVGTPCVSIFSSRDFPGRWFPVAERSVVLRKWVPCHTCFCTECPYDNRCINSVTAAEAATAAASLLDPVAAPGPEPTPQ